MSTRYVYVDESKRSGYVLAAVTVEDPVAVRRVVRRLVLPGQRRIHMKREQAGRRGAIVSALVETPIRAAVYEADRTYPTDHAARSACLAALIGELAAAGGNTYVLIERDDSLVRADQTILYRASRQAHQAGLPGTVHYDHQRAHEDSLLAVPDVVAWCWVRSGEWRRRIGPIVAHVRRV